MCVSDVEGVKRSLKLQFETQWYSCRKGWKWCLWLLWTQYIRFNAMSKGCRHEALTVLIVTHVKRVEPVSNVWNDVKGVKRSLISFNGYSCYACRKGRKIILCTQYRYSQCYIKRVERLCYMLKEGTNTFMLITFLIFNRFSIHKKFWKAET